MKNICFLFLILFYSKLFSQCNEETVNNDSLYAILKVKTEKVIVNSNDSVSKSKLYSIKGFSSSGKIKFRQFGEADNLTEYTVYRYDGDTMMVEDRMFNDNYFDDTMYFSHIVTEYKNNSVSKRTSSELHEINISEYIYDSCKKCIEIKHSCKNKLGDSALVWDLKNVYDSLGRDSFTQLFNNSQVNHNTLDLVLSEKKSYTKFGKIENVVCISHRGYEVPKFRKKSFIYDNENRLIKIVDSSGNDFAKLNAKKIEIYNPKSGKLLESSDGIRYVYKNTRLIKVFVTRKNKTFIDRRYKYYKNGLLKFMECGEGKFYYTYQYYVGENK